MPRVVGPMGQVWQESLDRRGGGPRGPPSTGRRI